MRRATRLLISAAAVLVASALLTEPALAQLPLGSSPTTGGTQERQSIVDTCKGLVHR